jgi:hypothetical protein
MRVAILDSCVSGFEASFEAEVSDVGARCFLTGDEAD